MRIVCCISVFSKMYGCMALLFITFVYADLISDARLLYDAGFHGIYKLMQIIDSAFKLFALIGIFYK